MMINEIYFSIYYLQHLRERLRDKRAEEFLHFASNFLIKDFFPYLPTLLSFLIIDSFRMNYLLLCLVWILLCISD